MTRDEIIDGLNNIADELQRYISDEENDKPLIDKVAVLDEAIRLIKHAPETPVPCVTCDGRPLTGWTVKEHFVKINEELDEFKELVLYKSGLDATIGRFFDNNHVVAQMIANEAADTITAITSMLETMGIDAAARSGAQRRVNAKNRERGRLSEAKDAEAAD